MFDMHNDLLSIAYVCYLKNNYEPLIKFREYISEGNVEGIVANMYFMTKEEMDEELTDRYYIGESIVPMFKKSIEILNQYIPNTKFIYSIEGCDYIDISELEELKRIGLDSILLVWNNPNKYGSGNKTDNGLTIEGRKFLLEAMRLGINIDLSHANERTFYDIISLIKETGYEKVYCSHSNVRNINNHKRNLYKEQIKELGNVGAKLGIVAIHTFASSEDEYIEHIKYAVELLGIDNVMISSDNMDFIGEEYLDCKIFEYSKMYEEIKSRLLKYYTEEEANKILGNNSKRLFGVSNEYMVKKN